jgi:hypothetical protein
MKKLSLKTLSVEEMEKIEGAYFWGTHCWTMNGSAADPGGSGTMCCKYTFWIKHDCTGPGLG